MSIFKKALNYSEVWLDTQIQKAQKDIEDNTTEKKKIVADEDEEVFYSKAITDDPNYTTHSQGFKEKPYRLTDEFLKQMAVKDTIIAAIIQTRQNQVSNFCKVSANGYSPGFKIRLKNQNQRLEELKEILKSKKVKKDKLNEEEQAKIDSNKNEANDNSADDDSFEQYDFELERKANAELDKSTRSKKEKIQNFLINAGEKEHRSFESKRWNLNSVCRAWIKDSLTYDRLCSELVDNKAGQLHSFFPVDGSTIKYATKALKNYKNFPSSQVMDFTYPEKQLNYLEKETDVIELDPEKLENDEYRYVQVIKGRIERAYTDAEMKIGMRNITTDIYANGYSVSELELLIGIVTSHLNTEYYNKAYFQQGFSAKGILHIKSPINRRKLETIRQQWHHMIKGNKNSFQTPIFAGMDDVKWLPLTQNHAEMEFSNWLNYLTKIMCAIYQIDPAEIGLGMKDEGRSSGGISGDNTAEKLTHSKDKGLKPLLDFLASYINTNIIDRIDPDFELIFVGVEDESEKDAIERQAKEVKFKKTVNEIRAEDNLPPLPGMDDVLLDPTYFQWYAQFSGKAEEKQQQMQEQQGQQQGQPPMIPQSQSSNNSKDTNSNENEFNVDDYWNSIQNPDSNVEKSLKKSKPLIIEYYMKDE